MTPTDEEGYVDMDEEGNIEMEEEGIFVSLEMSPEEMEEEYSMLEEYSMVMGEMTPMVTGDMTPTDEEGNVDMEEWVI